jgi:hypothetical protein
MQRKVLFRLIFVFLILGTCAYYVWVFQKYLRSTSDPIENLTTDADGVIKVNDGNVFLSYLRQDSLPMHEELFADWNLWMKWKTENPIVKDLMNGQSAYWVRLKDGGWYLFLPVPDRWNEEQLERLMSGIPNLLQWGSCLVWSSHSINTQGWKLLDEENIASWRNILAKCDGNAPFGFVGISAESKIALDYNEGEWVGFVEDAKWLANHQAVLMEDSIVGGALSSVLLSSDPRVLLARDEMKKRVFSLDTLCQCNVLESWVSWQNDQWKFQSYDGEHWVGSQVYVNNPWKAMLAFMKDTSSKVIVVKHPKWMPSLAESAFPLVPKYMSKRGKRVFVSDDSLSICRAIADTSTMAWQSDFSGFSDSRFSVFQGGFGQYPGLSQFGLQPLIYPREVSVVVVKNNANWLVRIAPIKE